MKGAYTRRETIVASLFGLAIAGIIWGPALLRPFTNGHTVDLGTLHLPEERVPAQTRVSSAAARVAKPRPGSRVDINHADIAALQTLPGIGPTLAQRIIAHRKAYGVFADPSGLLEVDGIGPKRFGKVEPWIEAR
ncbi:MAG: helix-hairpin-helix domain-containing protein [Candidatus Methylomirabilis oxyfera]|nr:helix-hairpin-helix domain-containing protein [Candidatus Methylomirabilis oxyfera]